MDTRTATPSPVPGIASNDVHQPSPPAQDKIAAYYSLVFPHFTFYVQTFCVTIGRRCVPSPNAATSSTAEPPPVDVDLGALKSVSRLHAKIDYDQDEESFVLVVIGRNGAWVDGIWSPSGTRAPLVDKSLIQIASRTFHFVLPPAPPPPEDTPSPSSNSSTHRQRSPSLDITSFSPPSSQPSHSPPPPTKAKLPPPPPEPQIKSEPQLPNTNAIGKSSGTKASTSKKRKKGNPEPAPAPPRPKPEDMPPKPPYTYAQLIYRAINAIGGKATLQEICTWISTTYDYYRWADSSWMSSVRHNLSSGRAFVKMERCGGDRGKGFFWSLDEKCRQAFEDQEAKMQQAASSAGQGGGKDGSTKSGRKKDKGAPLPPPLTSAPLAFRPLTSTTLASGTSAVAGSTTNATSLATSAATGVFPYQSQVTQSANVSSYSGTPLSAPNPYAALTQQPWGVRPSTDGVVSTGPSVGTSSTQSSTYGSATASTPLSGPTSSTAMSQNLQPTPTLQNQNAVPDVSIPIIIGPIPPTHPDYSPSHPNNSAKEGYMVLHERTLILDPSVFSTLTKEMLTELEKMGARGALSVLTGHMVRVLKEKRARERGVRRGRGGVVAKGGRKGGPSSGNGTLPQAQDQLGITASTASAGGAGSQSPPQGGPFTRAPLQPRQAPPGATSGAALDTSKTQAQVMDLSPASASVVPPVPVPPLPPPEGDADTTVMVVDEDSDDQKPALKRRKVDEEQPEDMGLEDEEIVIV